MIKEFKLEDLSPFESVKQQIWRMFDILRNNSIGLEDYHIVLLFLSLYKDDQISKDFLFVENQHNYSPRQVESDPNSNDLEYVYPKIIQSFTSSLLKFKKRGFQELIDALFHIKKTTLKENFSEIFESTLYQIIQSQGRLGGEFVQPVELTRFICSLADLPKNSKVFNPFAGLASFGVYLDQGQNYFGQEINKSTWALGVLRLMAHKRPGNSKYVCDDSIMNWPDELQKYDLIVANPPYGFRLGNQYKEIGPGIKTVEQFLLEKGIHSLADEGKLIALLPQGFLFNGYEQHLRKHLVNDDLLDTVISFPGGLLSNSGIPLIIIVINKKKERLGKVRFIRADKYVESKSPREKVLNDYVLNSLIQGHREDEDSLRVIDNAQIREWDYNLNVPRYFQKEIELSKNERLVKLKEILVYVKGQRSNLSGNGKIVRIQDLKDDKSDFKLAVSDIEDIEFRKPDIYQINESCLLIAIRWHSLKPTYFQYDGEPIYRNQDILSFRLDETIVDYGYIINELHADYVQKQLESFRLGATIPYIHKDDLMEIAIKLPSISEQRAKVQGILELSEKIKTLQKERNLLVQGKSIKQFNEFASLKHTLGTPRQNILDWSDNLIDFFSKNREGFEALNKLFIKFYDIDIIMALNEIKHDINFITDVLEKGENGLVLSDYEKHIIPLSDLNSIINELSYNRFNFIIKKLLLKGERLKEKGIYANKTLFITLLDNILTNANKYAFDKKATSNEVVIELTEVDDFLSMEIRNNGKPFPKNFDREKFITKYSTADTSNGSGLGGYDIHRIATDFNNPDWILSLNEDPFFLVKFKFQFPIKLIN